MKKTTAVLLILFISAVTAVFVFGIQQKAKRVYAQDGFIDLSSANVLETPVSIDTAGFSYYPDRLYTPKDFAQGVSEAPAAFTRDNLLHTAYGTYRLHLPSAPSAASGQNLRNLNFQHQLFPAYLHQWRGAGRCRDCGDIKRPDRACLTPVFLRLYPTGRRNRNHPAVRQL